MNPNPNNNAEVVALAKRNRAIRKAKHQTKRRVYEFLDAQLREIIAQDFDKIVGVLQMGGMVRVGIECAIPDEKLVNADAGGVEPPSGGTAGVAANTERTTETGNKIVLLD